MRNAPCAAHEAYDPTPLSTAAPDSADMGRSFHFTPAQAVRMIADPSAAPVGNGDRRSSARASVHALGRPARSGPVPPPKAPSPARAGRPVSAWAPVGGATRAAAESTDHPLGHTVGMIVLLDRAIGMIVLLDRAIGTIALLDRAAPQANSVFPGEFAWENRNDHGAVVISAFGGPSGIASAHQDR